MVGPATVVPVVDKVQVGVLGGVGQHARDEVGPIEVDRGSLSIGVIARAGCRNFQVPTTGVFRFGSMAPMLHG